MRGRKRKLPDYIDGYLAQICSDRFRALVEEFEPGIHQFEPVEVVWKDGTTTQFSWFVPCQRLDTLKLDMLHPPVMKSGYWFPFDSNRKHVEDAYIVFDKEHIGDHHIWCDLRMEGYICVSDKFHDAVREAKLTGIRMIARKTV